MELILKKVKKVKQLFFQYSLVPDFGNFRFYTNRLGCACVNSIYKCLKASQQAYVIIKQAMAALEAEQSPSIWLGVLDQ